MRLDRLHRAYPSLHPFGVVHWVPEQLNIKAVTGACKLIDGLQPKKLCSATPSVASSGICCGNKSQLNCLRLGLSDLRGHLFSFNLTDNPMCPLCLDQFESVPHFLFICTKLNALRKHYLSELGSIIPNIDSIDKSSLANLCLFGMNGTRNSVNKKILLSTMNYIKESGRFSRQYLSSKN